MDSQTRNECKGKIASIIKSHRVKRSNISPEERAALKSLKQDADISILPADKGRATVIMNSTDYKQKAKELLSDTKTYKPLPKDPTKEYKAQLREKLNSLKEQKKIDKKKYLQLMPTAEIPPRFYATPKIHKVGTPLRPIIDNVGTVLYNLAKYLTYILQPMVGNTPYHCKNSAQLSDDISKLRLEDDEMFCSADVSALFTSVPVKEAIDSLRSELESDQSWKERTPLDLEDIVDLTTLCLNCTYFKYDGQFYKQIHGAAMGSPLSPVICNLYMEQLEMKAISRCQAEVLQTIRG